MGVNGEMVHVDDVPLMLIPGTAYVLPSEFINVIACWKNIVEKPRPAPSVADNENVTDWGPPLRLTVEGNVNPVKTGGAVYELPPVKLIELDRPRAASCDAV